MTARRYVGRVLGFRAPESTTAEVRRELHRRNVDADVVARTGKLLRACDMVMFARREVELDRGLERVDEVVSIADSVDAWVRAQQPENEEELDASNVDLTDAVGGAR